LNFHNPELRRAVLDNVRFWLDKGVDGLRLDAINFCFHDRQLRDNPPRPALQRITGGFGPENPYAYQLHRYDNTQPENLTFLAELRRVLDEYPQAATLAEISSEDSLATTAEYTSGNRLHMGYSFELLTEQFSAHHIRTTVASFESKMSHAGEKGWPCWALSNHDVRRVMTRWGGEHPPRELANQLTALLCSLRGSVCIYQGEELGLTEAAMPFESLRDPYGIAFWPSFKGRDGCRTPMPWDDSEHGGFTSAKPWLPVPPEHRQISVAYQSADRHSVLNGFRTFLRWRKQHAALQWGDIHFIDAPEPVLTFVRRYAGTRVFAAFNLGREPLDIAAPPLDGLRQIESVGVIAGQLTENRVRLPGHGVVFAV
jgi:alpha-glucosidase